MPNYVIRIEKERRDQKHNDVSGRKPRRPREQQNQKRDNKMKDYQLTLTYSKSMAGIFV